MICLFVSSSSNTVDVFQSVSRSFDVYWSDCHYPKFVGMTSSGSFPGWICVAANAQSDWRGELREQICKLPPDITHVLLFLDDFFLTSPVDTRQVDLALTQAISLSAAYFRLVPRQSSAIYRAFRALSDRRLRSCVEWLSSTEPYPSALQVALWERSHLSRMLEDAGSIWQFEHQRRNGFPHAATQRRLISYTHLVEKGRWVPHASKLFNDAGLEFLPESRQMLKTSFAVLATIRKLKFAAFGYTFLRLRLRLGKLSNSG